MLMVTMVQILAEKRELLTNFNVQRSKLAAEKQHAAVLQVCICC